MGKNKRGEGLGRKGTPPRGVARRAPPLQPDPLRVAPLRIVRDGVEFFPQEEQTSVAEAFAPPLPPVSESETTPRFCVNLPPFAPVRNPLIFPFQFTQFGGEARPETLRGATADSMAVVEGVERRTVQEQGMEVAGDRGAVNNKEPSTSEPAVRKSSEKVEETIPRTSQNVTQQVLRTIKLLGMDLDSQAVSTKRKHALVKLRHKMMPGIANLEEKSEEKRSKVKKTGSQTEKKRSSSRISSQWGAGKKKLQKGGRPSSPLIIELDDTTESEVVVTRKEILRSRKAREMEMPSKGIEEMAAPSIEKETEQEEVPAEAAKDGEIEAPSAGVEESEEPGMSTGGLETQATEDLGKERADQAEEEAPGATGTEGEGLNPQPDWELHEGWSESVDEEEKESEQADGENKTEKGQVEEAESEDEEYAPEPLEEPEDSEDSEADQTENESDAERYEAERRRKGKQPASSKKKREIRPASQTVVIRDYLQVSDDDDEWQTLDTDSDESTSLADSEDDEGGRIEFEKMKVLVNSKTEEKMRKFEDLKKQEEFQDREKAVSKCRMHREVHYPSLDALSARRNFTVFITKLCCAWLVNLRTEPVPQLLACEFFTSFDFQTTIDLDIDCISFRLFGKEFRMNLTEWSVRLGIVSLEEALEAEFRSLEIGMPGKHFEFDIESAWRTISHSSSGQFRHGKPLAHLISNPAVRLTNNFLAYNLLGQHTCFTRISVNELYFMWCMLKGKGINLGFWLACQCHQISSHPSRHMSLCHVIGALLFYSFDVVRFPQAPVWNVVSRPEAFDLKCFCRTLIAIRLEDGPRFYRPGEIFPQAGGAIARIEAGGGDVESRLADLEQQQQQLIREVGRQSATLEELMNKILQEMVKTSKGKESTSRIEAGAEEQEQAGEEEQEEEEQGTTPKKTKKRKQQAASPRPSKRGR